MLRVVDWPSAASRPGAVAGRREAASTAWSRRACSAASRCSSRSSRRSAPRAVCPRSSPKGKRAITVKVNEVIGVAGFALPGNYVDVMVNTQEDRGKHRRTRTAISKIVLEHILVLAVAQEASRDDTKPKVVNAVTLEVTPEQAEKLDLARSVGTLSLVLRNQVDPEARARPPGSTKATLLGRWRRARRRPPPAAPPPSRATGASRRPQAAAAGAGGRCAAAQLRGRDHRHARRHGSASETRRPALRAIDTPRSQAMNNQRPDHRMRRPATFSRSRAPSRSGSRSAAGRSPPAQVAVEARQCLAAAQARPGAAPAASRRSRSPRQGTARPAAAGEQAGPLRRAASRRRRSRCASAICRRPCRSTSCRASRRCSSCPSRSRCARWATRTSSQARLLGPQALYLLGVGVGSTNMILQDASGVCTIVDVERRHGHRRAAGEARAAAARREGDPRELGRRHHRAVRASCPTRCTVDQAVMLANAYVRSALDGGARERAGRRGAAGQGGSRPDGDRPAERPRREPAVRRRAAAGAARGEGRRGLEDADRQARREPQPQRDQRRLDLHRS